MAQCEDPFFCGYKQTGYIINKDDIKDYDIEDAFITLLNLKEGAKVYKIQSTGTQPTATTQTFVRGTYYNKWNNVVNIAVVDHGADILNNVIRPMQSGAKFVVVLQHEHGGQYEVFGLAKGLQLQDGASREEYNEELNGGWNLPLEENGAPMPSYFFEDNTIFEELLTPEA
jgi:hypothetical protein